jgi:hypothetical protein
MISFLIFLMLIGVALYFINTLVPMDGKIKTVINVVVLILVLFYVLNFFGFVSGADFGGHYRR